MFLFLLREGLGGGFHFPLSFLYFPFVAHILLPCTLFVVRDMEGLVLVTGSRKDVSSWELFKDVSFK